MVLALAGASSGCVERLIRGGDGDTDSDSSSSTFEYETEAPECFTPDDCGSDQTCFEGTCVGSGELRVSLSWNVVSDFDLHVVTPEGVHISFESPEAGGGILDVDDCIDECENDEGTHVENIYFPDTPPRGAYEVWVHNFNGRRAGSFDISVTGAANTNFTGDLAASMQSSPRFEFTVP